MTKGLVFGRALEALKQNRKIAREGWNGKNMFLFLNMGSSDVEMTHKGQTIDGVDIDLFIKADKGTVTRLPNINMRSATGATVTGWLASQTDMLASDWCILD